VYRTIDLGAIYPTTGVIPDGPGMTWPSQCPGSASAQMFKFNLDPQGDNAGLRGW
jgi:hypothetical protein